MSRANVEIVRAAFAVVTIPGDPAAMIAASAPAFEMHLIGVTGEPVHYAGASGIREWFRDVAHSWESFRFEATGFRDLGDSVLVLGDVRARGRVSGVEVEEGVADTPVGLDVDAGAELRARAALDRPVGDEQRRRRCHHGLLA